MNIGLGTCSFSHVRHATSQVCTRPDIVFSLRPLRPCHPMYQLVMPLAACSAVAASHSQIGRQWTLIGRPMQATVSGRPDRTCG